MPDFSQRLKELRKERKLTQKQLAENLGIATSTIIKYERGEREPNIQNLKRFANYFNVTVDYLLGFDDEFNNLDLTSKRLTLFHDDRVEWDERGHLAYKDSSAKKMMKFISEQQAMAYYNTYRNIALKYGICSLDEIRKMEDTQLKEKVDAFQNSLSGEVAMSFLYDLMSELQKQGFCTWSEMPQRGQS